MATPLRDGRGSILGMLLRSVPSPFPRRAPRALAGLLVCLSVLLKGCCDHYNSFRAVLR
ncbi:hypothetical protein [Streptomyces sp. NPDC001340]